MLAPSLCTLFRRKREEAQAQASAATAALPQQQKRAAAAPPQPQPQPPRVFRVSPQRFAEQQWKCTRSALEDAERRLAWIVSEQDAASSVQRGQLTHSAARLAEAEQRILALQAQISAQQERHDAHHQVRMEHMERTAQAIGAVQSAVEQRAAEIDAACARAKADGRAEGIKEQMQRDKVERASRLPSADGDAMDIDQAPPATSSSVQRPSSESKEEVEQKAQEAAASSSNKALEPAISACLAAASAGLSQQAPPAPSAKLASASQGPLRPNPRFIPPSHAVQSYVLNNKRLQADSNRFDALVFGNQRSAFPPADPWPPPPPPSARAAFKSPSARSSPLSFSLTQPVSGSKRSHQSLEAPIIPKPDSDDEVSPPETSRAHSQGATQKAKRQKSAATSRKQAAAKPKPKPKPKATPRAKPKQKRIYYSQRRTYSSEEDSASESEEESEYSGSGSDAEVQAAEDVSDGAAPQPADSTNAPTAEPQPEFKAPMPPPKPRQPAAPRKKRITHELVSLSQGGAAAAADVLYSQSLGGEIPLYEAGFGGFRALRQRKVVNYAALEDPQVGYPGRTISLSQI